MGNILSNPQKHERKSKDTICPQNCAESKSPEKRKLGKEVGKRTPYDRRSPNSNRLCSNNHSSDDTTMVPADNTWNKSPADTTGISSDNTEMISAEYSLSTSADDVTRTQADDGANISAEDRANISEDDRANITVADDRANMSADDTARTSVFSNIHDRVITNGSSTEGTHDGKLDRNEHKVNVFGTSASEPSPLFPQRHDNGTNVSSHRVTNISQSQNFTTIGDVQANVLNIYQGQDNFSSEHLMMCIATAETDFVESEAFRCSLDMITSHSFMTVLGPSGAGKTTLSLVIAGLFQKKGYFVHFSNNILHFNYRQMVNPHVPTLLVFDDLFGPYMPQTSINHYLQVFHSIMSCVRLQTYQRKDATDLKVIITSKSDIFHSARSLSSGDYLSQEYVIDLSSTSLMHTKEEKIKLLEMHFKSEECNLPKKSELLRMISTTDNHNLFGFPGQCRLFVRNYNTVSDIETFWENPHQYLKPEIERLMCLNNSATAAIILMVLCNGMLNLKDFGTAETREKCGLNEQLNHLKEFVQSQYLISTEIMTSIRQMKGIFSVSLFDEASFTHPWVYDCAAGILGRTNPSFVLQHCNFTFIHEHVVLSNLLQRDHNQSSYNNSNWTINITNTYFQLFTERLSEEIKHGNIALAVTHQGLEHRRVVDILLGIIKGELKTLMHQADKMLGHHLLYWSTFSKSKYFLDGLLKYSVPTNKQKLEAVLGCCLNGNEDALTLLKPSLGSSVLQISRGRLCEIFQSQNEYSDVHTLSGDASPGSMTLVAVAEEYGHPNIVAILKDTSRKEAVEAALQDTAKLKEEDIIAAIAENMSSARLRENNGNTFLHVACAHGQLDMVKSILSSGEFDMEVKGQFDRTLIMTAVTNGQADLFEFLLERGADITLTDSTNNNLLHLACIKGNLQIIERLIELNLYDINSRGYELWTPLHFAVINGKQHVIDHLMKEGAELQMYCVNNNNALHLAAKKGHLDVLRWLYSTNVFDVNTLGENLYTPIAFAAEKGHLKILEFLLSVGGDPTLTAECGCHCLHFACNHGHLDIVKHLIDGRYINIEDKGGHTFTPLLSAVRNNCEKVVEYLIQQGAQMKQTYNDDNCLHIACSLGSIPLAKVLLATNEFDLNQPGTLNRTPAMQAIAAGMEEMVEYLVSLGARIDLFDIYSMNCLHLACEAGLLTLVVNLVEAQGFDVNLKGDEMLPIQIACRSGQYAVFEYLMSLQIPKQVDDIVYLMELACSGGSRDILNKLFSLSEESFDLDYQDPSNNYWSPIHSAAYNGNTEIVEELAKRGSNLRLKDNDGDCALHLACVKGHTEIVKLLVSFDKSVINSRGQHGSTPFMLACYHQHVDIVRYLYDNNAKISIIDNKGYNCFHLASMGGKLETIKLLLKDPNIQMNTQDRHGYSPLMWATQKMRSEAVAYLISLGADLNIVSNDGQSCLKLACHGGQIAVVDLVMRTGLVDINDTGGSTWTPIMNACLEGHQVIVDYLLDNGADISVKSKEGAFCLHIACMGGNIAIVKKLLDIGHFHVDERGENDWTPLMLAARDGHFDLVVELLKLKADSKLINSQGDACIHLAISGGHLDVVKLLCNRDPNNIDFIGAVGATPIVQALSKGNMDIFTYLYASGADVSIPQDDGQTSLFVACHVGLLQAVKQLLSSGLFDIDKPCIYGWTPLMVACRKGRYDVFRYLLASGASVEPTSDNNDNLFHLASQGGNVKIIKEVFSMGLFDINGQGLHGWTPLVMACQQGHPEAVSFLVANGADITFRDSKGNTCLHTACGSGHTDVVKILLMSGAFDLNVENNLGTTPLMKAAQNGYPSLVRFLNSFSTT